MFMCRRCLDKQDGAIEATMISYGKCEVCGNSAPCYDYKDYKKRSIPTEYTEHDVFFENKDNIYPDSEFCGQITLPNNEITVLQIHNQKTGGIIRFVPEKGAVE
jgi:hypothetical protein